MFLRERRFPPPDLEGLERLRRALGGQVERLGISAFDVDPRSSMGGLLAKLVGSATWLETTHAGRRVAIVTGYNEAVEEGDATPMQLVAVVSPASPPEALAAMARRGLPFWWSGVVSVHEPLRPAIEPSWVLDGAQPSLDAALGYELVGCPRGVLLASARRATLDVEATQRTLGRLVTFSSLPWRPQRREELARARWRGILGATLLLLAVAAVAWLARGG